MQLAKLMLPAMVVTLCAASVTHSQSSAFGQGDKILNVEFGFLSWAEQHDWHKPHYLANQILGAGATFEYGVHDLISVGGGLGLVFIPGFDVPIFARGAFHPFNLRPLADKIRIRDKLDAYAGLSAGIWFGSSGVGPNIYPLIGARWYFSPKMYAVLEAGSGINWIGGGIGFKF